jgi:copper resistance protein C
VVAGRTIPGNMVLTTAPDRARSAARLRLGVLAALAAVVAGLFLAPAIAVAHAELATVTPADKATVEGSPTEIVMTFTEALKPANSSIKLVDASNAVVAEGSTVDADTPTTMRLALADDLAPGTYTVRWISASAQDGDLDKGTTTFTVVALPSAAPSAAPSEVASASPSAAPSVVTSVAPSAGPSPAPTVPATSTSDAVIPIVVALIVLAALGAWLLRGRGRSGAR